MYKVSPLKTPISKAKLPGSGFSSTDSLDSEIKPGRRSTRASSAPSAKRSNLNGYEGKNASLSPPYSASADGHNMNKNELRESSDYYDNQSVQELEKYAVRQSEETTQKINVCLKVAEEIREVSSKTIVNLHQQGEQITQTHETATTIDRDLSRGEKLLGSLGGLFSRTWKPTKGRTIKGPRDGLLMRRGNSMEHRQKIGLDSKSRPNPQQFLSEPSSALERVEMEKVKQDDALSDLSNVLGELKAMAMDMGSEIERQNKALDGMQDDVEELNVRVRGANLRTRRLLGK
ncbi:hypothetical protein KSP40_PGU014203 [Platanthera guangdongensis]|uniref:t-SNARE coiled-coil homology domain-containing protein n=1 Tax=Platanthera guangdongensis TaxID=2320717 RepID=A0ABR2MK50_9ASPA